ncbi:MAG: DUF2345 domain-containing protein [Spirochaetaceae bacterium]|jgi:hypothetical protein|nr:DUF2345 domain-containing protein [Spirochaetaceae bacterium]
MNSYKVVEMEVTEGCAILTPETIITQAKEAADSARDAEQDVKKKDIAAEEAKSRYIAEELAKAYTFKAKLLNDSASSTVDVFLVMPVGGVETGLYRSPQAGDYVLVGEQDSGNTVRYLLGYLPRPANAMLAPQNFDSETLTKIKSNKGDEREIFISPAAVAKKGMSLRYKKTGVNDANQQLWHNEGSDTSPDFSKSASAPMEYSEIGFYSDMTPFTAKRKDPNGNKQTYYPDIDRINIQSTGDIHSTAANHHLMKGKRFEILADVDETDHTKTEFDAKDLPLGDAPGDDFRLSKGDIQIRADGRVIIKAGKEITLQVGRTKLTIKDGKLEASSRQIKGSNITTDFDATLTLDSRAGSTLTGSTVTISSEYYFSLLDAMGSFISGSFGGLSLSGKNVGVNALTPSGYAGQFAILTNETVWNSVLLALAAAEGKGKNPDINPEIFTTCKSMVKNLTNLAQAIAKFGWG